MLLSITFQEWADSIFSPIIYFVNWLKMVANSLIDNYIFLTLLCISLSISLIWLVINFILNYFDDYCYGIDKRLEKQKNYELYKDIQKEYLNSHRNDEFDYLYNLMILKQQVLNGIYQKHPDLLLDNKIHNYDLNAKALKSIKNRNLIDDDDSNDDDIDFISPPKVNVDSLLKYDDLKKAMLQVDSEDLRKENIKEIDRIMDDNKGLLDKMGLYYDKISNNFIDKKTGELLNLSNNTRYIKDEVKLHDSVVLSNAYYSYKDDSREGYYNLSFRDYLKDIWGYDESIYDYYKESNNNGGYHLSFDDFLVDYLGMPSSWKSMED